MTNLTLQASTGEISSAYGKRWTIENCFGHLSQALNAEIRTLGYPGAAGLCFSIALLLFNVMSLVRWLLVKHGQYNVRYQIHDVSYYHTADEISRTQFTIDEMVNRQQWRAIANMTSKEFARFLKQTAQQARLACYRKQIRGPTKPRPKRSF